MKPGLAFGMVTLLGMITLLGMATTVACTGD